jgi:hypothetical protein
MENQTGTQVQRETVEDARELLDAALSCYTGQEAIFQAGYTLDEVRGVDGVRAIQVARAVRRRLKARFPRGNF